MQRVTARKDYTCSKCGKTISKGVLYLRGNVFRRKTPIIACTDCGLKSYELSTSDYVRGMGAIVEDWEENYPIEDGVWDALAEELQGIKDSCEESLSNMPEGLQEGETGLLLQERIEALEEVIEALGEGDMSQFLEGGYDELSYEAKEAVDAEVDRRAARGLPTEYGEFYMDFWECRFTEPLTETEREETEHAAGGWKEWTEVRITEFVQEALQDIPYK